jgi:hypothetical protein
MPSGPEKHLRELGARSDWCPGTYVPRTEPHPTGCKVSPKEGLAFVKRHGIVLQAARGPVPSLAEAIVGGPIRGSWWGHPKGRQIFGVTEFVSDSPEVLVCKLVGGKVTYVHRSLWPALIKLASRFRKEQLAKVWSEHTPSGAHQTRTLPFPQWVPAEVQQQADRLSAADAERMLSPWLSLAGIQPTATSGRTRSRKGAASRRTRG